MLLKMVALKIKEGGDKVSEMTVKSKLEGLARAKKRNEAKEMDLKIRHQLR